jgi:anti-sigma-K factor RskA
VVVNVNEYIESGILELYACGMLSLEEMRDVELKSCQYAEIRQALSAAQLDLESYAFTHVIEPPAGLKEKIMREIEAPGTMRVVRGSGLELDQRRVSSGRWTVLLAAASLALLIVAGSLAYYFYGQNQSDKQQMADMQQIQSDLQQQMVQLKQAQNDQQILIAAVTSPSTVHVEMKGVKGHQENLASIFWNTQTSHVYLQINNLPAAPSNMQYQLWAIDPKKGPVSIGVFDVKNGIIEMENAASAKAFAVTLEQQGGSAAPTMSNMYVLGNVNS